MENNKNFFQPFKKRTENKKASVKEANSGQGLSIFTQLFLTHFISI